MSTNGDTAGLHLKAVMPAFTVNDIQASISWYEGVLGFRVEST